jgi:hypothetical protein
MQMEEYSQQILRKITGINPDLLGQDRGRQEPGVVIRLRQQQGVTLLKPLFRNLNNMKKGIFQRLISIICEYMPDEQILRILGGNERYQIDQQAGIIIDNATGLQAEIRNVRDLEYNTKSEESPGNLSKRMLELQALMEMMQAGMPVDPTQVIEKMELPETQKLRWLEYIQGQQESQQKAQEEQMQAQMQVEMGKIKVQDDKNVLDFILGSAKIDQMEAKDDKKMVLDVARLDQEKRIKLAEFAIQLIQALNQAKMDETKIVGEQMKVAQQAEKNRGDEIKIVQQGVGMASDLLKIEQDRRKLENEISKMQMDEEGELSKLMMQDELNRIDREKAANDLEASKEKLKVDKQKAKLQSQKAAQQPKGDK